MARQPGKTIFLGTRYGGNGYATRKGKVYFRRRPGPWASELKRKACFKRTREAGQAFGSWAKVSAAAWRGMPGWMRAVAGRYGYARFQGAGAPTVGMRAEGAVLPEWKLSGLCLDPDRVMPDGLDMSVLGDQDRGSGWFKGVRLCGLGAALEYFPVERRGDVRVRVGFHAVRLDAPEGIVCEVLGDGSVRSRTRRVMPWAGDSGWLVPGAGPVLVPLRGAGLGPGRWVVFGVVAFGYPPPATADARRTSGSNGLDAPSERWLAMTDGRLRMDVAGAVYRASRPEPLRDGAAEAFDGVTLLAGIGGAYVVYDDISGSGTSRRYGGRSVRERACPPGRVGGTVRGRVGGGNPVRERGAVRGRVGYVGFQTVTARSFECPFEVLRAAPQDGAAIAATGRCGIGGNGLVMGTGPPRWMRDGVWMSCENA